MPAGENRTRKRGDKKNTETGRRREQGTLMRTMLSTLYTNVFYMQLQAERPHKLRNSAGNAVRFCS